MYGWAVLFSGRGRTGNRRSCPIHGRRTPYPCLLPSAVQIREYLHKIPSPELCTRVGAFVYVRCMCVCVLRNPHPEYRTEYSVLRLQLITLGPRSRPHPRFSTLIFFPRPIPTLASN